MGQPKPWTTLGPPLRILLDHPEMLWRRARESDGRTSACIYTRYDASGDSNCPFTRRRRRVRLL